MLGCCWRGEMFSLERRTCFLFSSVVSFIALILLAASMATEDWVDSDLERTVYIYNYTGSRKTTFDGGTKYFGLFQGCETKIFGSYASSRTRCFNAILEVEAISDVHMVYATLVGLTASCFFLLVAIVISMYILRVKDVSDILETSTMYFVYSCAGLTAAAASVMFAYMYLSDFATTILLPLDINQGFSSKSIHLGYSYCIVPVASFLCFVNLIGMCYFNVTTGRSTCFNKNFTRKSQASEFPVDRKVARDDRTAGREDMMMY